MSGSSYTWWSKLVVYETLDTLLFPFVACAVFIETELATEI